VVVPTMLTSASNVEHLIEALEVRFLGNRDAHLHFGLLTDFRDAPLESLPEDEPLLQLARTRIDELNEKYGSGAGGSSGIFFLFHRPRQWNEHDRMWMGYERKRGKLAALNALLRGGAEAVAGDRFALVVGDTAVLSGVRYVITLDTDTQLPRDAARQFVGAMAHPLNRPCYDQDKGRVSEGYGILQPRVAISVPGTNRSRYARLYGGEPGIDPYTRVSSDVYQDVFGEGSFVGKGIYDVEAFEQALGGRFPENRILSHDLLEGCYARAGLLSDVPLYEDYPARYSADVSRRYRWIRGDWQLAGWLRRRVPAGRWPAGGWPGCDGEACGGPRAGKESALGIVAMEAARQPAAESRSGCADAHPAAGLDAPVVVGVVMDGGGDRRHRAARAVRHHRRAVAQTGRSVAETAPHRRRPLGFPALSAGAVRVGLSALRGVFQSRGHRAHAVGVCWSPASACSSGIPSSEADRQPNQRARSELVVSWQLDVVRTGHWSPWSMAHLPGGLDPHGAGRRGTDSTPLVLVSPVIAWWISLPLARRKATLTAAQILFLRALARRTWAFFEKLVGPEDHWFPPDNYQQYRVTAVAHRTSPTNVGMALLANLSAYDFGYLPAGPARRAHGETPCARSTSLSSTAGISTTGTTRRRCNPCRHATSRRWTAATWLATC
jgi:cyclic beta-1,2-glucan synthetase